MPIFNEKDHIAASLGAMRRQRFSGALEFMLVDGGSTDGTVEVLRRLARRDPRIRLLENPRREIPSGLNIALAHARGRWVARMDAHAQYPADYLERGVRRLLHGDVRWVSGPQVPVGRGAVGRAGALALATPLGRGGSGRWAAGTDGEAIAASGDREAAAAAPAPAEYELDTGVFCGVWERETLLEYGGWDERWPRNEDSELAARFLERGERLLCLPAMGARYWPRESLRSLWQQYLRNGEFRVKTARWHPDTLRRSNLLPAGVVLGTAAALAGPRWVRTPMLAALGGYGAILLGAGAMAARDAEHAGDAALVPAVLAVMHAGYGVGFLRGMLRHGVPLAALATDAGFERLAERFASSPGAVFAPSLHEALEREASVALREAA